MPTTPPSLPEVPTIPSEPQGEVDSSLQFEDILLDVNSAEDAVPSEPQGEVDSRLQFEDILRLKLSEPQPPPPTFTHPLTGREVFRDSDNPDSLMTEKSVDFDMDGKHWYAPSIYDGVFYTGEGSLGKIIELAKESGELYGPYDTQEEATAASKARSEWLGRFLPERKKGDQVQAATVTVEEGPQLPPEYQEIEGRIRGDHGYHIQLLEERHRSLSRRLQTTPQFTDQPVGIGLDVTIQKETNPEYSALHRELEEINQQLSEKRLLVEGHVDAAFDEKMKQEYIASLVMKARREGRPIPTHRDMELEFLNHRRKQEIEDIQNIQKQLGEDLFPYDFDVKKGFWEGAAGGVSVPFIGPALDAAYAMNLVAAARRVEVGSATEEEENLLLEFYANSRYNELRGHNWWGTAGEITGTSATFMAEIIMTRGLYGLGQRGAQQFFRGSEWLVSKGIQQLLKKTIKGRARDASILATNRLIKKGAKRSIAKWLAGVAGGAAAQATPLGFAGRIQSQVFGEVMPEVALSEDESGKLMAVLTSDIGDEKWMRAWATNYVEYFSERTGIVLHQVAKKAGIEAVATRLKIHIMKRWFKLNPTGKVEGLRKAILKHGAYDGIASEDFEEWLALPMHHAVDMKWSPDERDIALADIADKLPGLEEYTARIFAFGLPTGGSIALSKPLTMIQENRLENMYGKVVVEKARAKAVTTEAREAVKAVKEEAPEVDETLVHQAVQLVDSKGDVVESIPAASEEEASEVESSLEVVAEKYGLSIRTQEVTPAPVTVWELDAEGMPVEGSEEEVEASEAARIIEERQAEAPEGHVITTVEAEQEALLREREEDTRAKREEARERIREEAAPLPEDTGATKEEEEVISEDLVDVQASMEVDASEKQEDEFALAEKEKREPTRIEADTVEVVGREEQSVGFRHMSFMMAKRGIKLIAVRGKRGGETITFGGFQSGRNANLVYVQDPGATGLSKREQKKAYQDVFVGILAHELVHVAETENPEVYEALAGIAQGHIGRGALRYAASDVGRIDAETGEPLFDELSEGMAMAVQDILKKTGGGRLVEGMPYKDKNGNTKRMTPGLVERIIDWIRDAVTRLGMRGKFAKEVNLIVDQFMYGRGVSEIELSEEQEAHLERAREGGRAAAVPTPTAEAAPRFAPARLPGVTREDIETEPDLSVRFAPAEEPKREVPLVYTGIPEDFAIELEPDVEQTEGVKNLMRGFEEATFTMPEVLRAITERRPRVVAMTNTPEDVISRFETGEATYEDSGYLVAGVELRPDINRINTVVLDSIQSFHQGVGAGTYALKMVTNLAEKHGISVVGKMQKFGKGLSKPKLRAWYVRHGFDVDQFNMLTYTPTTEAPRFAPAPAEREVTWTESELQDFDWLGKEYYDGNASVPLLASPYVLERNDQTKAEQEWFDGLFTGRTGDNIEAHQDGVYRRTDGSVEIHNKWLFFNLLETYRFAEGKTPPSFANPSSGRNYDKLEGLLQQEFEGFVSPAEPAATPRFAPAPGQALTVRNVEQGVEAEPGTVLDAEISEEAFRNAEATGVRFAPAANIPRISTSDLKGRDMFVFFGDRMRVGEYTGLDPNSGISIDLQGGPGYSFIEGQQGIAGWAFTADNIFSGLRDRVEATDGVGVVALYAPGNIRGNLTFLRAYFAELQHAIDTKKLKKADVFRELNLLRLAALNTDALKVSTPWVDLWKKGWRTLEQAETALAAAPFAVRNTKFFDWQPNKKGPNKGAKVGSDELVAMGFPNITEMVRQMEEPGFEGLPFGTMVAAVEFEKGQEEASSAEDLGIQPHLSYPKVIRGRGIGFLEKGVHVLDVIQTGKPIQTAKERRAAERSIELSRADVRFAPAEAAPAEREVGRPPVPIALPEEEARFAPKKGRLSEEELAKRREAKEAREARSKKQQERLKNGFVVPKSVEEAGELQEAANRIRQDQINEATREAEAKTAKRVREEERAKKKEQMANARERKDKSWKGKMGNLRLKLQSKQADIADLRKELKDFIESLPRKLRSEVREKLTKPERWANITKLSELHAAVRHVHNILDEMDRVESTDKLKKVVDGLKKIRFRPEFEKMVEVLVGGLDLTKPTESTKKKLRAVYRFLNQITIDTNIDKLPEEEKEAVRVAAMMIDVGRIREVVERLDKVPISELSKEEADVLLDAIALVKSLNEQVNRTTREKRRENRALKARLILAEMKAANGRYMKEAKTERGERVPRKGGLFRILPDWFGWRLAQQSQPDFMANMMSGGRDTTLHRMLVKDLNEGYNDFVQEWYQSQDYIMEILRQEGINPDTRMGRSELATMSRPIAGFKGRRHIINEKGKVGLLKKTHFKILQEGGKDGIELQSGERLLLTEGDLIDLLCHFRDMDTLEHLIAKGEASSPVTLQGALPGVNHTLTVEDVLHIKDYAENHEGGRAIRISNAMINYANDNIAKSLEEYSVDRFGYSIVSGETHWTRQRRRVGTVAEREDEFRKSNLVIGGIDATGYSKNRVGGNSPIIIQDAFAKFSNLSWTVAGLRHLAPVVRDAKAVLAHKEVSEYISRSVHGREVHEYWNDMFDALTMEVTGFKPPTSQQSEAGRWLRRQFTKGVLAVNPRVAAYQTVSLIQASAIMPSRYLGEAVGMRGLHGIGHVAKQVFGWKDKEYDHIHDLIDHYSPYLRLRFDAGSMGLVTAVGGIESKAMLKTRSTGDWGMMGIRFMDMQTIFTIWRASELWVKEEIKNGQLDIAPDSDAFWLEVAMRTEDVVKKSQPTMDVLNSSGIARQVKIGKAGFMGSLATIFMSQRNKNVNMLGHAFLQYRRGEIGWEDLKTPLHVLVYSPFALMTISELYWWMLTGGDGPDHWEKTFSASRILTKSMDINFGMMPLGEALAFPWRTASNALLGVEDEGYYSIDFPIIGNFDDIYGTLNNISTALLTEGDEEERFEKVMKGAFKLAILLGQISGKQMAPAAKQAQQFYDNHFVDADHTADLLGRIRELTDIPKKDLEPEQAGMIEVYKVLRKSRGFELGVVEAPASFNEYGKWIGMFKKLIKDVEMTDEELQNARAALRVFQTQRDMVAKRILGIVDEQKE